MKEFLDKDFMLDNDTAKKLYHDHAARKPIIDYHCHLVPKMIADNYRFGSITEAWLGGDHYKWRALRSNGVPEEYVTGDKPAWDKFEKWAETMPYAMRNPLYHWTHLELSRIFGIDKVLKPATAREIYDECNAKLSTEQFRARGLMKMCNVELVCTTDDPADSLEYHKQIADSGFDVKVLPTWRPDKAMAIDNPDSYNEYIAQLEKAADVSISSYSDLMKALEKRHAFFADMGCRLSDHGMDTFFAEDYTAAEIDGIFAKVRVGKTPSHDEILKFRSAILFDLAVMDHKTNWTQQFHIGPIRNNNTKMFRKLGPDTGFDGMNDLPCATAGYRFLNRLATEDALAKTILYNLNSKDNDVMAVMATTYNDGTMAGKVQFGSAWWFLDQEIGMTAQMNALSMNGLLSRFVGMLTDSRSFLSYPRHEYFRRILCNIIGTDVEKGKLPASEMDFIGRMVEDISYNNAKSYFEF